MTESSQPNHHDDEPSVNELAIIDARLAEIEAEKQQYLYRRQQLLLKSSQKNLSPDQKVALFQKLFKGRSDVFATRW